MLPDPLHPAVVHLPIALAFVTPLFALLAAVAVHRRWAPARVWAAVLLLQILLVGTGWLAIETGEEDEERVEEVVGERAIESHEERAEAFLWIAGGALVVSLAGLVPGRAGDGARALALLATLAVLVAGVRVGHSGGELVYRHGAAAAHLPADAASGARARSGEEEEEHEH